MAFKYSLPGTDDLLYFLKAVIQSFMEVYQLAVSRVEILVRETKSLQLHVAVLKSRLQTASLHGSDLRNGKSAFQIIFCHLNVVSYPASSFMLYSFCREIQYFSIKVIEQ